MLQSSNAANPGDQLKHGLLAELLSRCVDWPSLTYAETHAGAGIYSAAAQASPRDHIVRLQAKLRSSDETATVGAGAAYARLLSDWWNQPRPSLDYPGSVVQAALLLRQGRTGRGGRGHSGHGSRPGCPSTAAERNRSNRGHQSLQGLSG
ncbi:MAG UNVERIFIED_CONTAM: hypothetical protein LVR18_33505 [Planctomycetaceae bacterium]|jgi:23S rRNA A2030 N6-methylase RlmJ